MQGFFVDQSGVEGRLRRRTLDGLPTFLNVLPNATHGITGGTAQGADSEHTDQQ